MWTITICAARAWELAVAYLAAAADDLAESYGISRLQHPNAARTDPDAPPPSGGGDPMNVRE